MIDAFYSIFFHPVPAWMLWMVAAMSIIVCRYMWACTHEATSLAENVLNQFARDQMIDATERRGEQ